MVTRRSAIKRVVALLGGTISVAQIGALSESLAAIDENFAPRVLSPDQLQTLKRIADILIPETDTPGAVAAGVHYFIDLMLAEWATRARQVRFIAGLEAVDNRARKVVPGGFLVASPAAQLGLIITLDNEAFAEGASGGFYRELKKLILFAYYSSEPGATVELRFQRIPGDYLPCVPMDDDGRAWFWNGYTYGL